MTSRHALWIGLGLAALPLFFVATNGCDTVFGLQRLLNDDALRCSCQCDSLGSSDRVVRASANDAEQTGASMNLTSSSLDLGEKIVGLRFDDVMLPARATITGAQVQFVSDSAQSSDLDLSISAELSVAAAEFTTTDNDISNRTFGTPISWSPLLAWTSTGAGLAQQTPELKTIIQELVDLPGWSNASAIVLRFDASVSGHRSARSYDGGSTRAAAIIITYDASVAARLPVCASAGVERDGTGVSITPDALIAECLRVEQTFQGLAAACGYPTPCHCDVVDFPDQDDSFDSTTCGATCPEVLPDALCENFDPNAFADCVEETGTVSICKHFVAATNASSDDSPVCVASGSPLAFHMFGRRSQCNLSGTSSIRVGDREPQQDPATEGTVEILGGPCVGGGCNVHPFFDLAMDPITFEVKFHSDPTFGNLSASGRGFETAPVDGLEATFLADSIVGDGNGQRGLDGLAISAMNAAPLRIGLDWTGHLCDMVGNVAASVDGEEGTCEGDSEIACTVDTPDCDDAGGVCVFEDPDVEEMEIDVSLSGTLVNQPPLAVAGPDQIIQCTSPAGASFTLDGRGSSDPDLNLAVASWRRASRVGPLVSNDLSTLQAVGVGASETYVLRVIDSFAQTDEDVTVAAVEDTTKPVIACNAPATIRPPSKLISFTATATDVCDPAVPAEVIAFDCFQIIGNGKRVDKRSSCGVEFQDATLTIRNKGGTGDHIQWTVRAADDTGNTEEVVCEVLITK